MALDAMSFDEMTKPHEPDDQQLIAALGKDQGAAAEQLFARYYQRLVGHVQRKMGARLKQSETASDVAQSVFRSVFGRGQQEQIALEEGSSLWPLLTTIALNKIRNRARYWGRERRDRSRQAPLTDATFLQGDPTPADQAILEELVEQVLAAFPERRQQILKLVLQGYSVGETAEQIGVSERTVYETRRKADEILRQYLAERDESGADEGQDASQ